MSHINTCTQYKVTLQHILERDKNTQRCGDDGKWDHNSYHHSGPHTELNPREQKERTFSFYTPKTELWLLHGWEAFQTIYYYNKGLAGMDYIQSGGIQITKN